MAEDTFTSIKDAREEISRLGGECSRLRLELEQLTNLTAEEVWGVLARDKAGVELAREVERFLVNERYLPRRAAELSRALDTYRRETQPPYGE